MRATAATLARLVQSLSRRILGSIASRDGPEPAKSPIALCGFLHHRGQFGGNAGAADGKLQVLQLTWALEQARARSGLKRRPIGSAQLLRSPKSPESKPNQQPEHDPAETVSWWDEHCRCGECY